MGRRDREQDRDRGNADVVRDERGRGQDVGREAYQDPNQRERNAMPGEPGEGREQTLSSLEKNKSTVGGKRSDHDATRKPADEGGAAGEIAPGP